MIQKNTEYYKMEFYNTYVVVEAIGKFEVTAAIAEKTIQVMVDHFKGESFVIVSIRKSGYTLKPDAYSSPIFKKVKGIAIVSKNEEVRKNAIFEQEKFDRSFAFFENLDDAKHWAQNFYVSY